MDIVPETVVVEKVQEATFEVIENLCRVLPTQLKHLSFSTVESDANGRYLPVRKVFGGIMVMSDTQPGQSEDIIKLIDPGKFISY